MKKIQVPRLRRVAQISAGIAVMAGLGTAWAQTTVIDPATDPALANIFLPPPEIEPLDKVPVPDVNRLGILDRSGVNAAGWTKITNPGNQTNLQVLGKALFWDMQVGGDGVQSCASCHFHAGADIRQTNQVNPGPGGFDWDPDVAGINAKLTRFHFSGNANGAADAGLATSEAALIAAGATPDALDGTPGAYAKVIDPLVDINDVISSQGIRRGEYQGNGSMRGNQALLAATDPVFGFNFSANAPGIPDTVRQVPGRNSPSVLNAVFNLRNFWDGRADVFFNGVNPLGVRDQNAAVKTFAIKAGKPTIVNERMRVPYSSLASQAVGPLGSNVEVIFDGRPLRELGRLLTSPNTTPLDGQAISPNDSLLGSLVSGSGRGLGKQYSAFIKESYDERFWGNGAGQEVCVTNAGAYRSLMPATGSCLAGDYSLMQWNFPLFFGLAVQAYEATLVTGLTIVDLIGGAGVAGTVSIAADTVGPARTINVTGLGLDACAVALSAVDPLALPDPDLGAPVTPEQQAALDRFGNATEICELHYAKFIDPRALSGTESAQASFPVPAGSPVGGCADPLACAASPNEAAGLATLRNVSRGLGRFSGGGRGCALCHGGSEFTVASVSAITGFGFQEHVEEPGAPPEPPEPIVPIERMGAFNGGVVAYDSGFYAIGVRPTIEDIGLGGFTNGVPKSWAKILEVVNGGNINGQNAPGETPNLTATKNAGLEYNSGKLRLPTSPTDMTPKGFKLTAGCDPALVEEGVLPPTFVCRATVGKGEPISRHGSFKTPGLRNAKFTGPFMHNGSKANLRQVLEFYQTAGHFPNLALNNLHEAIRPINNGVSQEADIIEFMETGLTDWRVAFQQAPFDHPELCLPNGHDNVTGKSLMTAVPAVGAAGYAHPLATFEEILAGVSGAERSHSLTDGCTVPGVSNNPNGIGLSQVDVPEAAPMP